MGKPNCRHYHPQLCSPTTELIGGQGWQTGEGFIDGIHLQLRHPLRQQGHHPLAHMPWGVVGATYHDLLIAQAIRHLKQGVPVAIPSCLASRLRNTMQPSLLESTTGWPCSAG